MSAHDNRRVLRLPRLAGIVRLTDRGVIRARGADVAAFLQGQLTNDVLGLDAAHARPAAFLSAKGRMQASFVVWRNGAEEFGLACARDLLPATLKRLSMFVLRAKCELDDATAEWPLHGAAGPDATALLGGAAGAAAVPGADAAAAPAPWQRVETAHGSAIRLPASADVTRALLVGTAGAEPPSGAALSLSDWNALDVASALPHVVAATVDRFVPQMVNFERIGGVDFKKGCYPGQEVVARSQYRGTLKRRSFLYACDGPFAAAGADVWAEGDAHEPVGTVVNAAPLPDGTASVLLIELRLAARDSALRLDRPDGPALQPLAMPYDVPLEADAS